MFFSCAQLFRVQSSGLGLGVDGLGCGVDVLGFEGFDCRRRVQSLFVPGFGHSCILDVI